MVFWRNSKSAPLPLSFGKFYCRFSQKIRNFPKMNPKYSENTPIKSAIEILDWENDPSSFLEFSKKSSDFVNQGFPKATIENTISSSVLNIT